MDQENEDSNSSLGEKPDKAVITCPRCYQLNSADAETCRRCRLDFVLHYRTKHLASISEPERRRLKIDHAAGMVKGGLSRSEYQVLRNDHAAESAKRMLPQSQTQSNMMIILAICFIILGWLLSLAVSSLALAVIVTVGGLVFVAIGVIVREHLQRVSNQFRESNSKAEGMVVVRRAERNMDDDGEDHSKYYLTIEFDAGDRIMWLETAVDESVYDANALEAKLTVRYCNSDPRIALIGREITREI